MARFAYRKKYGNTSGVSFYDLRFSISPLGLSLLPTTTLHGQRPVCSSRSIYSTTGSESVPLVVPIVVGLVELKPPRKRKFSFYEFTTTTNTNNNAARRAKQSE